MTNWEENIYAKGLEDYPHLIGVTIFYQHYDNIDDHEHCELCWDKISNDTNDLHWGYVYTSEDMYTRWICPDCVEKFGNLFNWNIIKDVETMS